MADTTETPEPDNTEAVTDHTQPPPEPDPDEEWVSPEVIAMRRGEQVTIDKNLVVEAPETPED